MPQITDADRQAAQSLRVLLADLSGFWFKIDDDSALCEALARHRVEAEQRAARRLAPEPRVFGPQPDARMRSALLMRAALAANAADSSAAA